MLNYVVALLIAAQRDNRPLHMLCSTDVPGWPAWFQTTFYAADNVGVSMDSPAGKRSILPWRTFKACVEVK